MAETKLEKPFTPDIRGDGAHAVANALIQAVRALGHKAHKEDWFLVTSPNVEIYIDTDQVGITILNLDPPPNLDGTYETAEQVFEYIGRILTYGNGKSGDYQVEVDPASWRIVSKSRGTVTRIRLEPQNNVKARLNHKK